jgi:hypothetical protein
MRINSIDSRIGHLGVQVLPCNSLWQQLKKMHCLFQIRTIYEKSDILVGSIVICHNKCILGYN